MSLYLQHVVGLRIATLTVKDDTGAAKAKWFGPQYIETRFKAGDTVAISGIPDIKKTRFCGIQKCNN